MRCKPDLFSYWDPEPQSQNCFQVEVAKAELCSRYATTRHCWVWLWCSLPPAPEKPRLLSHQMIYCFRSQTLKLCRLFPHVIWSPFTIEGGHTANSLWQNGSGKRDRNDVSEILDFLEYGHQCYWRGRPHQELLTSYRYPLNKPSRYWTPAYLAGDS